MRAHLSRKRTVFLAALTAGCCALQSAFLYAGEPASRRAAAAAASPFLLARALPAPLPKFTAQLETRFGAAFRHAPFETSGFDAFVLPFHYVDPSNLGHSSEAQAFAFLLSSDLDWAPGSCCARHCYFAFKRSQQAMQPLVKSYDAKTIAGLVGDWDASIAIGGALSPKKGGLYAANLVVYDPHGAVIWQKIYSTPQSFWDLLGHASADVMTALGDKPNGALAAYLRKPRCEKMESLAALGKAAFMAERSDAEFAIYESILKADPGFAEVRAWYANQKQWATRDMRDMVREDAVALNSRILPGVLATLTSPGEIDPKIAAQLPHWIEEAQMFSSADAPFIVAPELRMCEARGTVTDKDRQLLARGVQFAARYPNSSLLYDLSQAYGQAAPGEDDMDMAASLAMAYELNHFQPGLDKSYVGGVLTARPLMSLGYFDVAARFLSSASKDPLNAPAYLYCLTEIGQFDAACRYYDSFAADPKAQSAMATGLIIPAAMAGRRDILERMVKDDGATPDQNGGRAIVQAFIDRLDGKDPAKSPVPKVPDNAPYPFGIARAVLMFEDDMGSHGQAFRQSAFDQCRSAPANHIGWIMKDAYERLAPSGDGNDFYVALEYLHPDDPWVQAAAANWKKRAAAVGRGAAAPTDPASTMKNLTNFALGLPVDLEKASVWPITTGVMQFVERKRFSDARQLATLYRTASLRHHRTDSAALAQHLLHAIDAAEHPASEAGPPVK